MPKIMPPPCNNMGLKFSPPEQAPAIDGIHLGCAQTVNQTRDDLTAISISANAAVVGVFTRNQFAAAPVLLCRKRLQRNDGIRGILINAGTANAGTGRQGLRDAEKMCSIYAALLGCRAYNILPVSTGVIMERMPILQYTAGIKKSFQKLAADNWFSAARAIMTSDTMPKVAHETIFCEGKKFTVTGIAKGTAMIYPNMATMLAFVATDAAVPKRQLSAWQRAVTKDTFNAISVDGDTSTNDSFILIATGKKGECRAKNELRKAIFNVCARLAESIVKDGEGANKLLKIVVSGGASYDACMQMARAIALSPLVKIAVAANSADVGRFLMAIGNAAKNHTLAQALVKIGDVPIIKGNDLHPRYNADLAARAMSGDEVVLSINLGDSPFAATFKTCDLTDRYIMKFGIGGGAQK